MLLSKRFPYGIVTVFLLGWIAIVYPRALISNLLPTVEDEFKITHTESALLISSYLLSYAIVQLPSGSLGDKFGNKRLVIISMFGTAFGSILMSLAPTFPIAIIVRIIAGFASGFFYATASNIIVQNTESSQQGQALGTSFNGVYIASALISLSVGSLTVSSWRFFYLIGSIPGLISIPLMYFFIKENRVNGKQTRNRSLSLKSILYEAKKKSLLLALIFNFISSLSYFGLTFFIPTYFVLGRSLSVAEASSIMFIQALSSIGSGSAAGYLADRFGVKLPVIISTSIMCIVVLLFPLIPLGLPMVLLLIIWGVMGGWSFISMSVLVVQVVSPNVRGTFLGLYNEVGFISATIGPIILGFIIDISNFDMFFLACLIFYIAALTSILLIREKTA